jgi:hypothetical protein
VDLFQDALGDRRLAIVELELLHEVVDVADAGVRHLVDVPAPDRDGQ